jgi:hypothetical protein
MPGLEVTFTTAREIERIRKDFRADRYGHNDALGFQPSWGRIVYLAHAKGYVMVRRPGAKPFVIPEKLWRSFRPWAEHTANKGSS